MHFTDFMASATSKFKAWPLSVHWLDLWCQTSFLTCHCCHTVIVLATSILNVQILLFFVIFRLFMWSADTKVFKLHSLLLIYMSLVWLSVFLKCSLSFISSFWFSYHRFSTCLWCGLNSLTYFWITWSWIFGILTDIDKRCSLVGWEFDFWKRQPLHCGHSVWA